MAGFLDNSVSVGAFSTKNDDEDEEHNEYSINQEVEGGGRDDQQATHSIQPANNPLTATLPAENTPPEKQRETSASMHDHQPDLPASQMNEWYQGCPLLPDVCNCPRLLCYRPYNCFLTASILLP